MASTSSTRVTTERDAISQVLSPVLEHLDQEARSRIETWLPEIEEEIQSTLSELRPSQIKRRKQDTLVAAAMYDAFLKFESRTQTRLRTTFLAKSLGQSMSAVNKTWTQLFDNRVKLHYHLLEMIREEIDDPIALVPAVIDALRHALEENTPETEEWFSHIETLALDILRSLSPEVGEYGPEVLAALAVYAATKSLRGKPLVHITIDNLSLICGWSVSLLSRLWIEIFREGSISSSIQTEER